MERRCRHPAKPERFWHSGWRQASSAGRGSIGRETGLLWQRRLPRQQVRRRGLEPAVRDECSGLTVRDWLCPSAQYRELDDPSSWMIRHLPDHFAITLSAGTDFESLVSPQ